MNEENMRHGGKIESQPFHESIRNKRNLIGGTAVHDWTKATVTGYSQPTKNQFQADMCGTCMLTQMIQKYNTLILGKPFLELSEISGYSQDYAIGGGMSITELQDVAGFRGMTSFKSVPTPLGCTETQAESLRWQNTQTMQECLLHLGFELVTVNIDIDSVAQALDLYKNCGMLLQGMNNGTWLSPRPKPPTTHEGCWAHYMDFDPDIPAMTTEKLLLADQSWGASVGINGKQYFGEDYFTSGYIYDCFSIRKHIFSTDLSFGSLGTEVKFLQARLGMSANTIGFGTFGLKTIVAVKAYQTMHNIQQTGTVGPLTRASLNA